MRGLIQALRDGDIVDVVAVKEAFRNLVMQFLRELNRSAEISIVDTVLDEILSTEDVGEIIKVSKLPGSEYVVRKHVRGVIKLYLESIEQIAGIRIKDETSFGIQLTSIGLNLGMTTKRDTTSPTSTLDYNVVVMALLTFSIVAIALLKPK
jgi:hypothetical protein